MLNQGFWILTKLPFLGRVTRWIRKPIHEKLSSFTNRISSFKDSYWENQRQLDFGGYINNAELVADSLFSKEHASAYLQSNKNYLSHLLDEAFHGGVVFDNFVDIGCGKGKICIYAAKEYSSFKSIVGVDFSSDLVRVASQNLVKAGVANVTFICADAFEWHLPDGNNVIYLYNPFDEVILSQFLENNMTHFRNFSSCIVYANDVHRDALSRAGFEVIYRSQKWLMSLHRLRHK